MSSQETPALFNSEEWLALSSEEDKKNSGMPLPPPPSDSWKDPETRIFVGISSFRDNRCPLTLKNLFSKAKYPKRIFVGECVLKS